jgi:TonB family protein
VLEAKVDYPGEARSAVRGIVMVKALVGKDGRVTEAAVDTSQAASPALSKAAVEAVRGWRFEPARSKGDPVEVWIVVTPMYLITGYALLFGLQQLERRFAIQR